MSGSEESSAPELSPRPSESTGPASGPGAPDLLALALPNVPLWAVPEDRRGQVGPEGPGPMRAMAARAMLPLAPQELLSVLAYLGTQDPPALAATARQTAFQLPPSVLTVALADTGLAGPVLAFFAALCADRSEIVSPLLLNPATPDEAFVELAGKLREPNLLEIIGRNDVRCLREPRIIERLYFNPAAPMSLVARLVELAARNDVSLSHLPGWKEIVASVLGEHAADAAVSPGVSDAEFAEMLDVFADAAEAVGEAEQSSAAAGDSDGPADVPMPTKERAKALWLKLSELNMQQKVRMAIVGDQTVRRYLIRDPRPVVAVAVLGNPKLTAREVTLFAGQKSLDEEVIRHIARHREWTRHYTTRLSLVRNPKCPSQVALSFMTGLTERDIKLLKKDKDVPGYVQRQAGQYLMTLEKKRGG